MPRTLYDKLQVIVRTCDGKPGLTADELAEEVRRGKPDEFKIFSRAGGQKITTYSQPATIRQSIRLLVDLKLVESTKKCDLTADGRRALGDYNDALGQAVLNYLDSAHGIQFESIRKEILEIKSSTTNDVPTARNIYAGLQQRAAFSEPISEERFIRLLNLLGQCGLVQPSFRKFYWSNNDTVS
jgi:hypothetical protein